MLKALEAGQHAQALQEFERALKASPDDPAALRGRGLVRRARGEHAQALQDLSHWARVDPDNAEAHWLAAHTALALGRHDEALASIERLIEKQPDYQRGGAFQLRATLQVKRGDFGRALEDARRACDLGNAEGCKVIKDNQAAKGDAPRRRAGKR